MINRRVNEGEQLGPVLSQTDTFCGFISSSWQILPPYYPPTSLTSTTRSCLLEIIDWNFVLISYFRRCTSSIMYILIDINKSKWRVETFKLFD